MPDRILLLALDLKRVDYDRLALRLALTTAEINFADRRRAFLSTMHDQNDGNLAVGGVCLDVLNQVLSMRGVVEFEGNEEYHRNTRAEELVALTLAKSHVGQLQGLIGPQGSRWLGEGDGVDTRKIVTMKITGMDYLSNEVVANIYCYVLCNP